MKTMKKLLSLLVAVVMTLAMATTAFAAPATDFAGVTTDENDVVTNKATITISGLDKDATGVNLYQVAYATYDEATGAVTYELTDWTKSVLTAEQQADFINALGGTVGEEAGLAVEKTPNAVASKLFAAITDDAPTVFDTMTLEAGKDEKGEDIMNAAKAEPVGIYLAKVTTNGSTVYNTMMASVNLTVDDKGEWNGVDANDLTAKSETAPDVVKTADEIETGVGEEVNFEINTFFPNYDKETYAADKTTFKLTDTLTALDLDENIEVYVNDEKVDPSTDDVKTYTLTVSGDSFVVAFDGQYILDNATKTVTIKYKATVTEDAVNFDPHMNEVVLEYSKNPNGETDTDTDYTKDYTFDIDGDVTANIFNKTEGDQETKVAGAEFTVYTDSDCSTVYTNGSDCWKEGAAGTVVSGSDGQFKIGGLAEGTYYIKETDSPDGYSINDTVYEVVITTEKSGKELTSFTITVKVDGTEIASNTYTGDNETYTIQSTNETDPTAVDTTNVINTKLAALPSTGGIGTTIFTVVGSLIMIAAVALFFVSRRKRA